MVRFTRSICIALVLVAQTSASNKWFSLWPVASDRFEENNKVTEDLANRPGIGKDNFMKSESPTLGVMYWFAKLSDEDVKHYDSDEVPGVCTTHQASRIVLVKLMEIRLSTLPTLSN